MTVCADEGLMLPFPPDTDGVTVKVLIAKVADTVQLPVIAPVVYVLPDKVPLQPVTDDMLYPELGVTVNEVVEPLFTV